MDDPMDAGPSTVAKVDDRIRLENSLTLITYHEDGQNSRFVVERFRHRHHQQSMGEPQSKGAGHVLFPEEATYLVEVAQAVVKTTEGRYMTLEELFMVLGDFSIPQQVYSAYCACKRAGFVVIRPGILEHAPASPQPTVNPTTNVLPPFRVRLRALLDSFPDMGKNTAGLRVTRPDLIPEGCRMGLQPKKPAAPVAAEEKKSGKRRKDTPSLRPRAWPSLAYASKHAGDWKEYAALRATLLGKSSSRKRVRNGEKTIGSDRTNGHDGRSVYSSPADRSHFLLYSAKGYTHTARRKGERRPIARVTVFDFYSGRPCPSHPPCREDVDRRINDDVSSVPLLKAYVSLPRVSFTKESGAPIDLASLKQRD
ncbi:hypothetical protein PENTCL1PPCAC_18674 [Pristionchus entomophagus]|uniref:tRNA-splicing endonuclease subunit Sen54 N-terminal domain-containing protein n=1 Tax=Pristionchus entomophagus TaxID=358040 RepID=A0AAV5TQF7_9BILA|nr:hypothetical protein PENTCL1PPCAC_18674 [Pristionchus entomophagus]